MDRVDDKDVLSDVHLDLADLKKQLEKNETLVGEEQKEGARKLIEEFAFQKGVHGYQKLKSSTKDVKRTNDSEADNQ